MWFGGAFEHGARRLASQATAGATELLPPYPWAPVSAPSVISRQEDAARDSAALREHARALRRGIEGPALADAMALQAEITLGRVNSGVQALSRCAAESARLGVRCAEAFAGRTPYEVHLSLRSGARGRHVEALRSAVRVLEVRE